MRCGLLLLLALLPPVQDDRRAGLLRTFREEFVAITPGEAGFPPGFDMGRAGGEAAEKPVHRVTLKEAIRVARYEVPQNLWESVMGTNPSRWKGERNSVERLTFDEALEFCTKVTELLRKDQRIEKDQVVRLPSEAEWEYFARAGTATAYSFGDDPRDLAEYGWYTGNAAGNDPPVGAKKPNPWGLYDIHGYVWEWCLDAWHPTYEGAPADGQAWTSGGDPQKRVLRGGSWKDEAKSCTSFTRRAEPRDTRDDAVGLRCVLASVKPK
jgi:formylglycine-generating enzyme required for sulfatase activity